MLKTMKHLTLLFFCLMAWSHVNAQVSITYNNEAQWKTYDDFNAVFLDSDEFIYKADTKQARADHRGNGYRDNDVSGCAAAIGARPSITIWWSMPIIVLRPRVTRRA